CSGLVLFAKTSKSAAVLSRQWSAGEVTKQYLAVVPKGITPEADTLTDHVSFERGKARIVEEGSGQMAVLHYRVISEIDKYALLEVTLETGRTHQIRLQLSAHGFPVKGDVRYGARRANSDRGIHLHGYQTTFMHPTRGSAMTVTAPVPDEPVWKAFDFS
ncbi:MAG: RluA family pseudouridine synthase, partial [Saprospiraceae bacterium]|nr:RluA family pseudouridine synthase [Saprospiraceae bacterium]